LLTVAEAMPEDKYDSGNHCREKCHLREQLFHIQREYELVKHKRIFGREICEKEAVRTNDQK
jgi:hypothetical protein